MVTTVKLTCNKFIGGLVLWEHENVDMDIDACATRIQWKSKKVNPWNICLFIIRQHTIYISIAHTNIRNQIATFRKVSITSTIKSTEKISNNR